MNCNILNRLYNSCKLNKDDFMCTFICIGNTLNHSGSSESEKPAGKALQKKSFEIKGGRTRAVQLNQIGKVWFY